jgi:hypothetical protein
MRRIIMQADDADGFYDRGQSWSLFGPNGPRSWVSWAQNRCEGWRMPDFMQANE